MSDTILEVNHLCKYFKTPKGLLHAVDDVSFTLERGSTLGIVGESGCGKSTLGRSILRLLEPTSGQVIFDGQDITELNHLQMQKMRSKMQIIFQDPYASLDPRRTVYQTIAEPIILHKMYKSRAEVERRVLELMDTVGLAERLVNTYPHELDGGRRQRIGIARALALNPQFIVCDEPVSALDVSIQAQIINLLKQLQRDLKLSFLFITHDLAVVNHFSDEIMVMYQGKAVEKAPAQQLFQNPLHPYTKALLSAIPIPDLDHQQERVILRGEIASPVNPSDRCRFCKRCYLDHEECLNQEEPGMREVRPGHFAACYRCS